MDNNYEELKHMIIYVSELNKKQLEKLNKTVDRLINWKIKDEDTISAVFDQLLSLVFVDQEELKRIYYKLLNYTKVFNEELSNDYEEIYLEQMLEQEEKELIKKNKKPMK